MSRALGRMGGWCAAHPFRVLTAWLVVVAGVVTLSVAVGGSYKDSRSLPGTEVAAADQRLQAHFPSAADTSADLVLYDASAAHLASAMPHIEAAVGQLRHVIVPSSWPARFSADRSTVLLRVNYNAPRFTLGGGDVRALKSAGQVGGVTSYVSGVLANDVNQPGSGTGEKVGVAVALLVLLLAFGSVIAALMPIATAALAILTGLAFVKLLADVYAVSNSAPAMATMLGLGVGIDYALFVVSRHREGMRNGLTPQQAAATAMSSAGTSVLWAGVTVVVAICGLGFAGIPVMTSLGLAAAIVVACSVAAALTILPALLSLTGDRIDRLHVALPHLRHDRAGSRWVGWARAIERRPVRFLVGSATLLVVLAIPLASMRLGMPDASAAPANGDAHRAFELTAHAFGAGANAPLSLVVALPKGADRHAVATSYRNALLADRDVAAAGPMTVSPDGSTGLMTVTARSAPQAAASSDLVSRLRADVLPPVRHATGTGTWLTGMVAGRYDVAQRVLHRLPWFVLAVLSASFVLLMLVFRSVLVPVKAVLLNLLSIASALGVVVAVFSWGWLRQLVGLSETVPLVDVIPMLMFAVVFGLSMDYEVFLLSRVREEWVIEGDGRESVVRGLASTAQVISAAAAIMVAVFLAFTLSHDVVVKTIGLGMAVAVFLDATVIRLVLVPATMALLGDLNWWVPRWLDRILPHIDMRQETDVPIPVPTP